MRATIVWRWLITLKRADLWMPVNLDFYFAVWLEKDNVATALVTLDTWCQVGVMRSQLALLAPPRPLLTHPALYKYEGSSKNLQLDHGATFKFSEEPEKFSEWPWSSGEDLKVLGYCHSNRNKQRVPQWTFESPGFFEEPSRKFRNYFKNSCHILASHASFPLLLSGRPTARHNTYLGQTLGNDSSIKEQKVASRVVSSYT